MNVESVKQMATDALTENTDMTEEKANKAIGLVTAAFSGLKLTVTGLIASVGIAIIGIAVAHLAVFNWLTGFMLVCLIPLTIITGYCAKWFWNSAMYLKSFATELA